MATGTETKESQTSGALVLAVFGALLAVLIGGVGVAFGVRGINEGNKKSTTSGGGVAAGPVSVTLTEFKISPSPITVSKGGSLSVANIGAVEHNLEVDGKGLKMANVGAGKTGTLDLSSLSPGNYKLFCNIAGHRAAGMETALTVAEPGAAVAAAPSTTLDPVANHDSNSIDPFAFTEAQKKQRADAMDTAMLNRNSQYPAKTEGEGGQLLQPKTTADGYKLYELTAQVVKWETEPGKKVNAWTYNGTVPAPTIKVNVGDKVRVTLKNDLPESTALHFHGLSDIPNAMDGVAQITQDPIKPGQTFTYEFTVTRQAVAMYHSHHNAQVQVIDGMAGAFLVGEVPTPAGLPEPTWKETMFLSDSGNLGYGLNGKSFPATKPYAAKLGDWVEMTYMNEGMQIHPMHLHGPRQLVIAIDGEPLTTPYWEDTVNVAPGQRVTVRVKADNPGVWAWHCHILNHAEGPDGMFGMVTALIIK